MPESPKPKVSVVIPCLNEEKSIGSCIEKARIALEGLQISYEVVVCDNASTDRTADVAKAAGARVVLQPMRGYGAAYLKGIEESNGEWIIMGDGDETYDFSQLAPFFKELTAGADMVMGSRFKGTILPGAMPWLHQYIGNPFLSGLLNVLFGLNISDSHCGMRAFSRDAFQKMNLVTTGMEFASEMVIKAAQVGLKIAEVPIVYHPREGESKLRSFRDGWRHLRFMLLYSPGALFLIPGTALSVLGWFLQFALLGGPAMIWGRALDYHFMFVGCLLALLGAQILQMGVIAKVIAQHEGLDPKPDPLVEWLKGRFDVDRGVLFGTFLIGAGLLIYLGILLIWMYRLFGPLEAVRPGIFALTLIATGTQTLFSSFMLGMLNIPHLQKSLSTTQSSVTIDPIS